MHIFKSGRFLINIKKRLIKVSVLLVSKAAGVQLLSRGEYHRKTRCAFAMLKK